MGRIRCLAAVLGVVLALAPSGARAAEREITVVTRDGRTVHGRLVSETERGFLVALPDTTVLIPYAEVKELRRGEATAPAEPSAPAEPAASRPVDLGIGGGALWGPTIAERREGRFFVVGPLLQLPIEFAGDRLGFRFTPQLGVGFVGPGVWRKYVELSADLQLRVYLGRHYAIGLGGFLGGGLSTSGVPTQIENGLGGYGVVGPSLTPLDLRFGENEVQFWVGLAVDFGDGGSGAEDLRPALTYAYHF